MSKPGRSWVLSKEAFEKLLLALDLDREQAGYKYEILRQKLVKFFEWRGAAYPEDHADEVLNRLTRRIDRGEVFRDLSTYSLGVARMLLLELSRDPNVATIEERNALEVADAGPHKPGGTRLACLEQCLEQLTAPNRDLILEYYQREKGDKVERRRKLATRLGLPLNALRIRAHRIRISLEECVTECLLHEGEA